MLWLFVELTKFIAAQWDETNPLDFFMNSFHLLFLFLLFSSGFLFLWTLTVLVIIIVIIERIIMKIGPWRDV